METCGIISERFIHLNKSYWLETTKMIIWVPFLAPNSYSVGTITPKINPNLLPVVLNIEVQFQSNWNTYTEINILKVEKLLHWAPFWPLIPKRLEPSSPKSIPTFLLCYWTFLGNFIAIHSRKLKLLSGHQMRLRTTQTTTTTSYHYTIPKFFLRSYKKFTMTYEPWKLG